jgi:ATP-dependent Clp protease ATP-binding subunit ClpC
MKETLKSALEQNFRPEFHNRLDDIIVFRSLTREDLQRIVDIELEKVFKRLKEKGMKLVLTPEAREHLIDKGYSPEFGARPLRRAIEHLLEDPLAEELLRGTFAGKETITVRLTETDGDKKFAFEASGAEAPQEQLVAAEAK